MKKIILISGDPNSINSELIYKSLKEISKKVKRKNISNFKFKFDEISTKKINYKLNLSIVKNINEEIKNDDIKLTI